MKIKKRFPTNPISIRFLEMLPPRLGYVADSPMTACRNRRERTRRDCHGGA
jgi:hypothetical protein